MNNSSAVPRMLREKVQKTGSATFRVTGMSMLPAIWPYSRITVKMVDFGAIRTGDVICYMTPAGIHCHRVIARVSQTCFTLGDTFPHARPEMVTPQDLIGLVHEIHIGPYRIKSTSKTFNKLKILSPMTGVFVRKTIHAALWLPLVGRVFKRLATRLKDEPNQALPGSKADRPTIFAIR